MRFDKDRIRREREEIIIKDILFCVNRSNRESNYDYIF